MKHLKQLVRNIIDPARDLGHVDRHNKTDGSGQTKALSEKPSNEHQEDENPKLANENSENTIPTDPDAVIATGPLETRGKDANERKKAGACNDCT